MTSLAAPTRGRRALTGNEAVALAMRQVRPHVVAAYPITPQTELMHRFAEVVAAGEVDTELVLVESEHSAISAVVGASAAGARAMTATSSQGLALMFEVLHIASGLRLPIVMPVANRALAAPINIHCDHSDAMSCRDTGWIQLWAENAQEAYDHLLLAVRVAERADVRLPVMVCYDGFLVSHTLEPVEVIDDASVREWAGEYRAPRPLLDLDHPVTIGPLALQDAYFEHKIRQAEAFERARVVLAAEAERLSALTSREHAAVDAYRLEDADAALVMIGSSAGTAKEAIDAMRDEGERVGLLRLRQFRPFPADEIASALADVGTVGVLDRALSLGTGGGPLASEIRAALWGRERAPRSLLGLVYGLGGRDLAVRHVREAFERLRAQTDEGRRADSAWPYLNADETKDEHDGPLAASEGHAR